AADMIWPAWQYPHCGTPTSTHAACRALPTASVSRPSMVTTFLFAAAEIGVMQERTACPSRWTVQAPHSAMPQPNLVPVRPSSSRNVHKRGGSPGKSTFLPLPLISSRIIGGLPLLTSLQRRCNGGGMLVPNNRVSKGGENEKGWAGFRPL